MFNTPPPVYNALVRRVRPGHVVPDSGAYVTESGQRATLVRGHIAPATWYPGETWYQEYDTILTDWFRR